MRCGLFWHNFLYNLVEKFNEYTTSIYEKELQSAFGRVGLIGWLVEFYSKIE